MADDKQLSMQNLNCEVTASDVSFDFGDTSRFRKIKFPEQQTPFYSWFLRSLWLARHPICMFSIFRRAFRGL